MAKDESTKSVALLAREGAARDRLREALNAAGVSIVLEGDPNDLDPNTLRQAGAQIIVLAMEPAVENALDTLASVLEDPHLDVIFDDAELAARRRDWEAQRWIRHLLAKLRRSDDVLPPGHEGDANRSEAKDSAVPENVSEVVLQDVPSATDNPNSAVSDATVPETPLPEPQAPADMALEAPEVTETMLDSGFFRMLEDNDIQEEVQSLADDDEDDEIQKILDKLIGSSGSKAGSEDDDMFASLSSASTRPASSPSPENIPSAVPSPVVSPQREAPIPPPYTAPSPPAPAPAVPEPPPLNVPSAAPSPAVSPQREAPIPPPYTAPSPPAPAPAVPEPPPLNVPSAAPSPAVSPQREAPIPPPYTAPSPPAPAPAVSEPPPLNVPSAAPSPPTPPVPAPSFHETVLPVDPEPSLSSLLLEPMEDIQESVEVGDPSWMRSGHGDLDPMTPPPAAPSKAEFELTLEEIESPETVPGAVLVLAGIGGPDAVRKLLHELPSGFPLPMVVQLRLDGGRYDNLVKQIARVSAQPVRLAEVGSELENSTIYVLPDHVSLEKDQGVLRFVESDRDEEIIELLPPGESAVLFLSGSNPKRVEAAVAFGEQGGLVGGQSLDGCYDATAVRLLAGNGIELHTPSELVTQLVERWGLR